MLKRATVRLRVLKGAIVIGKDRLIKGRSFDCDAEYAEHLMQNFPGSYEIIPEKKSKKNTEVTSGDDI